MGGLAVTLRPMTLADLPLHEAWLHEPHFARWITQDYTVAEELAADRAAIAGDDPTTMLVVQAAGRDIGWAQWYRWADYPEADGEYGPLPGELGIDYGIGDPAFVGRGLGTALIAELVRCARAQLPDAPILAGPSAANTASRRVLEKNGFVLVDVRDIAGEPNASPIALYRLVGDLGGA